VHNTGGRALDMYGALNLLAGPGGLRAGPFAATLGVTLGIGDTEAVRIAMDRRLPAGPWTAEITLRSGLVERTAHAEITFPAVGASAPVRTSTRPPAWLYAAGVLLAVLGLATLVIAIRRRRTATGDLSGPVTRLAAPLAPR
jgi:hypothetical protein